MTYRQRASACGCGCASRLVCERPVKSESEHRKAAPPQIGRFKSVRGLRLLRARGLTTGLFDN